jgi:amino acid transporter
MAQTKRKRKHRGTAAGTIEKAAHNRSTKGAAPAKPTSAKAAREARMNRPPTWRSAANKAAIAAIVFGVFLGLIFKRPVYVAAIWTVIVFFFYTPLGYWTDRAVYNRRMRAKAKKQGR